MKSVIAVLLLLVVLSLVVPHSLVDAKSAKDSKAHRDIDKAIGRAVEGKFSTVKTVNISTYAAPNVSLTVWNKTSSGSLPPIITPPEPQVCNKNEHLENGTCVPDTTVPPVVTPAEGYKVCMVGDFKDSKVFDAMSTNDCDYRVAVGDNGYGSDLSLLKSIHPDKCVIGNHDSVEDESAAIEKEALAYCGNSWWVKFGSTTLLLGFNTNGDTTKQLNAAGKLLNNSQFMSGVKNVIAVSHKGGHIFPSAHHPAEAKTFYTDLEKAIPNTVKLFEINGHNHDSAAAPLKGWYVAGNGGKSFYACGNDKDWTYCDNKTISYLEATIPNSGDIAFHFVDTSGKTIF